MVQSKSGVTNCKMKAFFIITRCNILHVLSKSALHSESLFTHLREKLSLCFCAASSNVNNSEAGHAVISGLHPLAFTTAKGSSNVNEAVTSGCGQLHLLSLIT